MVLEDLTDEELLHEIVRRLDFANPARALQRMTLLGGVARGGPPTRPAQGAAAWFRATKFESAAATPRRRGGRRTLLPINPPGKISST